MEEIIFVRYNFKSGKYFYQCEYNYNIMQLTIIFSLLPHSKKPIKFQRYLKDLNLQWMS